MLEFRTLLPCSQQQVWTFHQSPGALLLLTPPGTRVSFVGEVPPPDAGVEFSLLVVRFGIPMRWRVRYTQWNPPLLFEDEQVKGPFARWRHQHRFEPAEGGTMLVDRVEYLLPGGILGRLVDRLFVRRDIEKMFEWRHTRTGELLSKVEND